MLLDILQNLGSVVISVIIIVILGVLILIAKAYKKVPQGQALVRTGIGGLKVAFNGIYVIPIFHRMEMMDISIKTIEISREQGNGLICQDNLRADIRVAFYVRVNRSITDVEKVAQSIGSARASDRELLFNLFESKFSEALKTVGKRFDFVDLYNQRDEFKKEVIHVIGKDLNGYILDDCAIDYLEQTDIEHLDAQNILDAEGIKKITDLTATQHILANQIQNEERKKIKQQDVSAQEAVLELEKQQAEAEAKQKREIAIITSREDAEAEKVRQEERLKSEQARIQAEEEIGVMEHNKSRQIIVAEKSKEKTEAVETEKVVQAKDLEINERERVVELARIAKEKAIEEERKNIQDVIRERVEVERAVVQEEEKIKDTRAMASAEREKAVAIKIAEKNAEESLVKELKSAEAAKEAAKFKTEQEVLEAEAEMKASENKAVAKKTMADANAAEIAAHGLAEAQVMEAKAEAEAKKGEAEAQVIEAKAEAEAKGIEMRGEAQAKANEKIGLVDADLAIKKGSAEAEVTEKRMLAEATGLSAKAEAEEKYGLAEATVMEKKALVEAQRIKAEAEAMKAADGVTTEMEKFRLNLAAQKEIQLAKINVQKDLAEAQAAVLAEALKSANIDIIGGETMFFQNIMNAIAKGKTVDGYLQGSDTLTELKTNLLGNGAQPVTERIQSFIKQFGLKTEDIKNLSLSALLLKMGTMAKDEDSKGIISKLMETVKHAGIGDSEVASFL
ncbi:MAG: flotillin family protein [Flammeovirgaceae bacterium]